MRMVQMVSLRCLRTVLALLITVSITYVVITQNVVDDHFKKALVRSFARFVNVQVEVVVQTESQTQWTSERPSPDGDGVQMMNMSFINIGMKTKTQGNVTLVSYVLPPPLGIARGKYMHVPTDLFEEITHHPPPFVDLDLDTALQFVFATGADAKYFGSSLKTLTHLQKYFPGRKILYYNLGLNTSQIKQVQSLCQVEMRTIEWRRYPKHVLRLKNYAFKNIAIYQTLREFPVVFWVDASIRFFTNDSMNFLRHLVAHHGVLYLHGKSGYLNMAVTDPKMFDYVPSNETLLKYWLNRAAGVAMYARTENVYNNVMRWMMLCSLDSNCLQPSFPKTLHVCKPTPRNTTSWIHCHRYDQSLVAVLTGNWCWFGDPETILPYKIMDVMRGGRGESEMPRKCPGSRTQP